MPTQTPNYSLTKPDSGTQNWATTMNANLDAIDSAIAAAGTGSVPPNEVSCINSAVFDRSLSNTQHMLMTGNVYNPSFIKPASGIMCVVLTQDGTGGHEFTFPSSGFKGATNITTANGLTTANTYCCQLFSYIPSTGLYVAVAPLIYGE